MRPTKTFTLPNGDIATLNEYVTFGERMELTYINKENNGNNVAEVEKKFTEAIVRLIIVSITKADGTVAPSVQEYLSALPFEDGAGVFTEACNIAGGKKTQTTA